MCRLVHVSFYSDHVRFDENVWFSVSEFSEPSPPLLSGSGESRSLQAVFPDQGAADICLHVGIYHYRTEAFSLADPRPEAGSLPAEVSQTIHS